MTDSTPADRTLTWWPIVGAAVLAVIVVVVILSVGGGDERPGSKRDDSGALACPAYYNPDKQSDEYWVPTDASGVDGKVALVPDAKPSHVTVCQYASFSGALANVSLSGHRTLRSGVAILTKQLAALPKKHGGATAARTSDAGYLLGVTYDTGYVWIAVPGSNGASNGQFTTGRTIAHQVDRSYRTGAWPTS